MIILFLLTAFAQATEIKFNFAYQNSGGPVYIQAGATAGEILKMVCDGDAHLCECELKSDSGVIGKAKAQFHSNGAYFTCEASGEKPAAHARIVKKSEPLSPWLQTLNRVDLEQILGDELNRNRVRSIYEYNCTYSFLQKQRTSKYSFDCSSQSSFCGTPGSKNGDFCLLKVRSPYYLYADNYSTNFSEKGADSLYGSGHGICGLQIPQYECTGTMGMPVLQFGLYGQLLGIWNLPVELEVSPTVPSDPQGYAQRVSTLGNCPPWLEKRALARAQISMTPNQIDSNFPDVFISNRAIESGSSPIHLAVSRVKGGDCDGMNCTKPNIMDGDIAWATYAEDAPSHFCAIPAELVADWEDSAEK